LTRLAALLALGGGALAQAGTAPASPPPADLLIRNGHVVDGSGNPWFLADVAVRDGRIAAIGRLDGYPTKRSIDAKGRVVAPGFIDVHAHLEQNLFGSPEARNYVHDGVTSVITGNCGGSADNLQAFLQRVDTDHTAINVGSLVGHNTVRKQVMGSVNRFASATEQQQMEALVEQAMRDGAMGLSTGLIYLPGLYSNTDEVVGLAKAAAKHDGLYASHIRDEGRKVVDAINEALQVGRAAHMPVQISHFKVSAPVNWGRSKETLALVENARAEGLDVTIDQYPYTASSTNLGVTLPDWAVEGGDADIRKRLADPVLHRKIAQEMLANARANQRPDYSYAVVARHPADPSLNGKNLSEINRLKGRPATMESEIETLLDLMAVGGAQMVYHGMNEDDVRYIMRYPFNMMAAADGGVQDGSGLPHPRSYGTNARVLGKYVREEHIMPLEEAVRRMTSLAAQRFQLKDRGLLRPGYIADIVVFDPQTIADKASFDNPHQLSTGISHVLVNGQLVVDDGRHTGAKPGVALRGPGYVAAAL
jgi:N-acyl-D-amino-acid deacylase